MVSAMAGALIGAAGLAWWLLSEAEKRRLEGRQLRVLRLSRHAEAEDFDQVLNLLVASDLFRRCFAYIQ